MEKYKIIGRKSNGNIILESNKGNVMVIDESKFSELFTKTKDAVIDYVKRGKDILVKIGNKLISGVSNIYNILSNKDRVAHIFLNDDAVAKCEELGLENPNGEFEEFLENADKIEAVKTGVLFAKSILMLKNELNLDSVDESIAYKNARILNEKKFVSNINGPHKGEIYDITPTNFIKHNEPLAADRTLSSTISGVSDFDSDQISAMLGDQFIHAFAQPLGDTSFEIRTKALEDNLNALNELDKKTEQNDKDGIKTIKYEIEHSDSRDSLSAYKPYLIFGESGIGKTTIINDMVETLKAISGKEVSLSVLTGTDISNFGISAPAKSGKPIYKKDGDGKIVRDENGEPIILGNYETIAQTPSKEIPMYNYKEAVANNNVVEMDMAMGYGVLFIDELSRSELKDQPYVMRLVRNYGIGDYRMGTHWVIVCATNPAALSEGASNDINNASDVINSYLIDNAVKNSFQMLNYKPDINKWLEWAKINGVNRFVIDFLSDPRNSYHWFNNIDEMPIGGGSLSNPRLWSQLGDDINKIEQDTKRVKTYKYAKDPAARMVIGKYDLSIIEDAKAFIEKVREKLKTNLPFEEDAFVDYLNSELIEISDADYENMWKNPSAIMQKTKKYKDVLDSEGNPKLKDDGEPLREELPLLRLRNADLNSGVGRTSVTSRVVERIVNKFPMCTQATDFKKYVNIELPKYLNNFAEFVSYFYSANTNIKEFGTLLETGNGSIKVQAELYNVDEGYKARCKEILKGVMDAIYEMFIDSPSVDESIKNLLATRKSNTLFNGSLFRIVNKTNITNDTINCVPVTMLVLYNTLFPVSRG